MPGFTELKERLRAFLILAALVGIVVVDSASKIISICADGFIALIVLALVWPMIKSKKE